MSGIGIEKTCCCDDGVEPGRVPCPVPVPLPAAAGHCSPAQGQCRGGTGCGERAVREQGSLEATVSYSSCFETETEILWNHLYIKRKVQCYKRFLAVCHDFFMRHYLFSIHRLPVVTLLGSVRIGLSRKGKAAVLLDSVNKCDYPGIFSLNWGKRSKETKIVPKL